MHLGGGPADWTGLLGKTVLGGQATHEPWWKLVQPRIIRGSNKGLISLLLRRTEVFCLWLMWIQLCLENPDLPKVLN